MIDNEKGKPVERDELQYQADGLREDSERTIGEIEDYWNLEYVDGRGCDNQHNAILNLLAIHLDRIATELEVMNRARDVEQRESIDIVPDEMGR